ncbi:MAG: prepilin-type N-terminal cleavage/methylation domain-containing protein [bacterium]
MRRNASSFTLVELLIVVAIIGVLAAIAVPSFLNAHVRANVARARADLRTTGTALECYYVDNSDYPPHALPGSSPGTFLFDGKTDRLVNPSLFWLTSPVAYLSSIALKDPFINDISLDAHQGTHSGSYRYFNYQFTWSVEGVAPPKGFCVYSHGPDTTDSGLCLFPIVLSQLPGSLSGIEEGDIYISLNAYSPSNGLHSSGDIAYFGGQLLLSGLVGG